MVATKPRYLHADHQGSTIAVTNKAGQRVGPEDDGFLKELIYDPFGRRIDAENKPLGHQRRGGPRQGYTEHDHVDEIGVIDMGGRYYDAGARRFLTPDPHVTDPLNSQSLNRYSYVWNNPVNLTDPTGFDPDGGDEITLEDKGGFYGSPFVFGSGFGLFGFGVGASGIVNVDPIIIHVPPVDVDCNTFGTCYGRDELGGWVSNGSTPGSVTRLSEDAYISGNTSSTANSV